MKLRCVIEPLILLTLVVLIRCDAVFAYAEDSPHVPHRRSADQDSRENASNDDDNLLLLVIFDGFRYDYLEKTDTPNFDRLVAGGVKPASAVPVFATKTFPGHHTIVTGLYQESHGIMGNRMYDPEFDATFNQGTTEPRWWNYGGEPIWATNQKNGGQTISVFYPGDRVNISGYTATFHEPAYDGSVPFNDRVDKVVGFMSNGSANLGLLYFQEPDSTGHLQGPDSPELVDMLKVCDDTMGYLLDQLTDTGLIDRVNIIVTSDHGMTNVSSEQTVFLDDYVDRSLYFYTDNDPVFGIWPNNETDTQALYDALSGQHPNMTVYLKADIPDELHYRENRRVSPILIVMDQGWHVWTNRSIDGNWQRYNGNHGFRPSDRDMHAIFIASGPDFKSGYQSTDSFEATEIYNLMCHLLDLSPAPNNGTLSNVDWLLADSVATTEPTATGQRATANPFPTALLMIAATMILRCM